MSTKINVLNLIINGLPSIHIQNGKDLTLLKTGVLNLIINGLPSIRNMSTSPLYLTVVLNLIINGLPSILKMLRSLMKL